MLKDYTDSIIKTASRYSPKQRPNVDIQGIGDALKSMQTNFKIQDLASALESGDQEAINKARSALDPTGYANFLDQQAQRAEDRQWALEDADRKYQQALALENIRNQNARNLAEFKAGLGSQDTTAMRNMEYLVSQGYTPQEAAALYYGGQNSTLNLANLGQKGQETLDKKTAENYAEDLAEYESMVSKLPELLDTVANLDELGANATYTTSGQALDSFRREMGMSPRQAAKDRAAYISMIDNQVLPLLRDTFGAQFTQREGDTLRKTLGDPNMHPEEKKAQIEAFIRQKQMSIESKARKLMSYRQPSLKQFKQDNNEEVIPFEDL